MGLITDSYVSFDQIVANALALAQEILVDEFRRLQLPPFKVPSLNSTLYG